MVCGVLTPESCLDPATHRSAPAKQKTNPLSCLVTWVGTNLIGIESKPSPPSMIMTLKCHLKSTNFGSYILCSIQRMDMKIMGYMTPGEASEIHLKSPWNWISRYGSGFGWWWVSPGNTNQFSHGSGPTLRQDGRLSWLDCWWSCMNEINGFWLRRSESLIEVFATFYHLVFHQARVLIGSSWMGRL